MITPESQARSWGIQPTRFAWPGALDGMSLALFGEDLSQPLTLAAPPDLDSNVLTVILRPHAVDMEVDGKTVHRGTAERGDSMLLRPGERPAASIGGTWSIAQYYIPDKLMAEIAVDLELPTSCLADLRGPRFSVDRGLLEFSTRLVSRLAAGTPVSRLELDEYGLMLVEHLLLAYLPGKSQRPATRVTPRLGSLLEEYLSSGENGDMYGFARRNQFAMRDVFSAVRRRRGTLS